MNNDKLTKGELTLMWAIFLTLTFVVVFTLYGLYSLTNKILFVEEGRIKEVKTPTTTCDDIKRPPFILQCIKNANQSVDDPEDSVYSCSQLGDKLFCETTYETQTFKYTDNQWSRYE